VPTPKPTRDKERAVSVRLCRRGKCSGRERFLNVSKASVYRFLHAGSLPYVQYGPNGSVRVPEVELEMWIAERRKDTDA
jgi:excisionase family DNA binding protein